METRVSVEYSFRWDASSAFHGASVSCTFVSNKWGMTAGRGGGRRAHVKQCYCMRVKEPRDCNEIERANFARWWTLQERVNMGLHGMPKISRCGSRRQFEVQYSEYGIACISKVIFAVEAFWGWATVGDNSNSLIELHRPQHCGVPRGTHSVLFVTATVSHVL